MKKVKKLGEGGSSAAMILGKLSKKYGENAVSQPRQYIHKMPHRFPTGNFAITLGTGGGYPIWCMSRYKGPESGGKSTSMADALKISSLLCWRCMNIDTFCTCEDKGPFKQKALYVNAEGTFDVEWMKALGVDDDSYYICDASEGEEQLSMVEAFLGADDGGLVIIDSVAQLMPPDVSDRQIGDYKIGAHSKLMADARWKLTRKLAKEKLRGHPCLILTTNQLRKDISVMFGDPEIETGGKSFKHWITLGLRVQKISLKDTAGKYTDVERGEQLVTKHGWKIDKNNLWVYNKKGEYLRAIDNIYSEKDPSRVLYHKGQIIDHDLVMAHALKLGLALCDDRGAVSSVIGGAAKNAKAFQSLLRRNDRLHQQLQIEIARAERQARVDRFLVATTKKDAT